MQESQQHVVHDLPQAHINQDEDAPSRLQRLGHIAKHGFHIYEETIEGASIGYSDYLTLLRPVAETRWGYAFVITEGLAGAAIEILHIKSVLPNKRHMHYRILKEALGGATVAAIFAQRTTMPENYVAIVGGATVLIGLTTGKALIELFRNKRFFKTKFGKTIEYGALGVFSLSMAAGVSHYLFSILEGFDLEISKSIEYSVTASLALVNLAAELPINKYIEHGQKSCLYWPAHFFRSVLYGGEIGLFLTILLFDIYTNIEDSDDLKDSVFWSLLVIAALQGILVATVKFFQDNHEQHEHDQAEITEEAPLLLPINNGPDEAEESGCRTWMSNQLHRASDSCHAFWYSKCRAEENQDASRQVAADDQEDHCGLITKAKSCWDRVSHSDATESKPTI